MVQDSAQHQQVADGGGHEAQVEGAGDGAAQQLVLGLVLWGGGAANSGLHEGHGLMQTLP